MDNADDLISGTTTTGSTSTSGSTSTTGTTSGTTSTTGTTTTSGATSGTGSASGTTSGTGTDSSPDATSTTSSTGTDSSPDTGAVSGTSSTTTSATGTSGETPDSGASQAGQEPETVIKGDDTHHGVLEGHSGNNLIEAGSAGDTLVGGSGSNTLVGGAGDDLLVGANTSGTDVMSAGNGHNIMVAGGAKTQQLDDFFHANKALVDALSSNPQFAALTSLANSASSSTSGVGNTFQLQSGNFHDQIYNFHASSDVLEIQSGINGSGITGLSSLLSHVSISGNDVSVDLGGGSSVTLVGVDVAHLSAANVVIK